MKRWWRGGLLAGALVLTAVGCGNPEAGGQASGASALAAAGPVAVAAFDGSEATGAALLEEYLDGTGSYAQDPEAWIADYRWSFGDGTPEVSAGWVQHRYERPGSYTAYLTVTDSRGRTATTSVQIVARDATSLPAPLARASFDGSSGCGAAPSTQYFDGTASEAQATGAWIADYAWDFGDGSGVVHAGWTAHTYSAPGSYRATLTATDSGGRRATATLRVEVTSDGGPCGAQGGQARWLDTFGGDNQDTPQGLAVTGAGTLVSITNTESGSFSDGNVSGSLDGRFDEKLVVAAHRPDGTVVWWIPFRADPDPANPGGGLFGSAVAAAPDGSIYVAGGVTGSGARFGQLAFGRGPFLLKLSAAGDPLWVRPAPLYLSSLAVDAQGRVLGVGGNSAMVYEADGSPRWARTDDDPAQTWYYLRAVADPAGGFIVGGQVNHPDRTVSALAWLAPDGRITRLTEIGEGGPVVNLSADREGNLVASGFVHGALHWGGQQLNSTAQSAGFLVRGWTDGRQGWAMLTGTGESDAPLPAVGEGQLVVASRSTAGACSALTLTARALDPGDASAVRWSRTWAPATCSPGLGIQSGGLAVTPGGVVLLGAFDGAFDFGQGTSTSSQGGLDGFLLELAP